MTKQLQRVLGKLYKFANKYYDYGDYGEPLYSENGLSEKERAILSENGWKANDIEIFSEHDEIIEKIHLLKQQPLLTERRFIETFIAGVGGSYLRGRSVLSAWHCMNTLPLHAYNEKPEYRCCWICGEIDKKSIVNNSHFQYIMHLGNAFSYSPQYAYLNLKYLVEQPAISPTVEDIQIFSKFLELLRTSPADETPGKFEKRVREAKFLPAAQHVRGLLHSLALVGIIPNQFITLSYNCWTDYGDIAICEKQLNNTRGRSDMAMPWAGWCGTLKIDEEKTKAIFGDYLGCG